MSRQQESSPSEEVDEKSHVASSMHPGPKHVIVNPIETYGTHHHVLKFVGGGLSCMAAACVTNPIDVIKTRLQIQVEAFDSFFCKAEI